MSSLRHTLFALNLTGLVFLILAMTGLSVQCRHVKKHVICLVDVSRSLSGQARTKEDELVDTLRRFARKSHCKCEVMPFAAQTFDTTKRISVSYPPESTDATNITVALQAAANRLRYADRPEIFLLSDGGFTDLAVGQTARQIGIPVSAISLPENLEPEVAISRLALPPEVHAEEPFTVTAYLSANCQTETTIICSRNGEKTDERRISLNPGITPVEFEHMINASQQVQWEISLEPEIDTSVENNQIATTSEITEKAKLLFISLNPPEVAPMAARLFQYGFDISVLPPEQFPENTEFLSGLTGLFFSDIPLGALTETQIDVLDDYVRNQGGSFFLSGGPRSFAAGKYFDSPLETLLPVRSEYRPDKDISRAVLLFLIDRSGSMKGEKENSAKSALLAALDELSGGDRLAVITFDQKPNLHIPFTYAFDADQIRQAITEIASGGGTDIEAALLEAESLLEHIDSGRKQIILLTDGNFPPFNPEPFIAKLGQDKIPLTVVELKSESADETLKYLAISTGGIYYPVDDPASLPRLFAEETERVRMPAIEETESIPTKMSGNAILSILTDPLPPLDGYVRTEAKEESEVLLTMPGNRPLLVSWHLGLGTVTVWTSDITTRWFTPWLSQAETAPFWSALIRTTEKAAEKREIEVRPPSPETIPFFDGEEKLKELAQITGGEFNPELSHFFQNTSQTPIRISLRLIFTLIAFFLFAAAEWISIRTNRRTQNELASDESERSPSPKEDHF